MIRTESRFRRDVADFVDGRLDDARRTELEKHLETCSDCRREWQALVSVKAALQPTKTEGESPELLVSEIRAVLDREDRAALARNLFTRAVSARRIAAFAAAAAVILALLLILPRRTDPSASAARDWARLKQGGLHLEMRSASPQAISQFFSTKDFGFPVPAASLELPGYALVGARVHLLAGKASALYVYRDAESRIVVCQMYKGSVEDLPPPSRLLRQGSTRLFVYRALGGTQVFWQDGPVVCVLASDISPEEVVRIASSKTQKT